MSTEQSNDTSTVAEAPSDTISSVRSGSFRRADILDSVPLGIEVVLGRTTKLFGELREIQVGSPITLDRSPNQPVDVLVNGSPFAKGEIVVINDENLGVRITEILHAGPGSL